MAISHKLCIRVLYRGVDVTGACIEAAWSSDSSLQTYAVIRQETGELETITDDLEFLIDPPPPTAFHLSLEEKPEPLSYDEERRKRNWKQELLGNLYSPWVLKDYL